MMIQHLRAACLFALGGLINNYSGAIAEPLVCTTIFSEDNSGAQVQNTCKRIETTYERLEKDLYTWRAPYNSGVGIFQSMNEDVGFAYGGINGTNFAGFGFPEQTILWDAGILQKNVQELLENQTELIPLRTADLPNAFESSLADMSFREPRANQ